jgi:DNA-binding NtrC family response regulator
MKKQILVIEDDGLLNKLIVRYIQNGDREVVVVKSWHEADRFLEHNEPDLIITDVKLPDGDSLTRIRDITHNQPVILLTAYGSVRDAVQAMRAGAFEYLVKPLSPDEVSLVVQRALDDATLRKDHYFCKQRLRAREGANTFMIGVSDAFGQVKEMIEAVATSEMTVLILGESGTGKELVARAIHDSSGRAKRNFVAVDCCTLQETLFESELFGHEKGAFTGADKQKKGLIEGADGGTLFLDEIGEIDPTIQAKLLRVLESGKFRRVGGTKDLNANTRIVAATNRNLEALSAEGGFRADLYYRLSAFTINTPPLRERREDIPDLVEHFLKNHTFSRPIDKRMTGEARRCLVAYDWPGNIRELKNVVERSIILSREKRDIRPEHLAFVGKSGNGRAQVVLSFRHNPTLEEVGVAYLKAQLEKFSGRRAKVAEVLNISERNLYRLIKRHELGE